MATTPLLEPREVVERTGLSIDTLRYYEREGLIGPVQRQSGQRRYSEDDIASIGLVTCLRAAGLRIGDLRRVTDLLHGEGQAQGRVAVLQRLREELQDHLHATQAAIDVVDDKMKHYHT